MGKLDGKTFKEKALECMAVARWTAWAKEDRHPLVKEGVEVRVVYPKQMEKIKPRFSVLMFNEYVGWREGRKWIHILYRTLFMFDARKGQPYAYYIKIRKDKYPEIVKVSEVAK